MKSDSDQTSTSCVLSKSVLLPRSVTEGRMNQWTINKTSHLCIFENHIYATFWCSWYLIQCKSAAAARRMLAYIIMLPLVIRVSCSYCCSHTADPVTLALCLGPAGSHTMESFKQPFLALLLSGLSSVVAFLSAPETPSWLGGVFTVKQNIERRMF